MMTMAWCCCHKPVKCATLMSACGRGPFWCSAQSREQLRVSISKHSGKRSAMHICYVKAVVSSIVLTVAVIGLISSELAQLYV